MKVNTKALRRQYDAAVKDKKPQRFYGELFEAIDEGQLKLEDFSIRELFEEFVPDGAEIVQSWNPRHGGGGVILMEAGNAINTRQFSNISGQLLYTKILEQFQMEQFVLSNIIPTVPTKFSGERIPGISGIGDEAEVVDELQPYPMSQVGEDWIDTPQTVKRGTIVALSKEAIFFDRTNVLIPQCEQVGEFLGLNKEKRLIDALIDQNSTAYRYNWRGTKYGTFQASTPWINVKTTNALVDWTNVDALEQIMAAIRDPWTGEPIMINMKHMMVTRQLLYTARRIISATEIRVTTPGYATSGNPTNTATANPIQNYQLVSSQLIQSRMAAASEAVTDWFIGDFTKVVNYYENFPLTVTPGPSNSEVEFTQDIAMRWKANERGTPVVVNPRFIGRSSA